MAAPKGHKRYGGRTKGTPNKTTQSAKEAIALAADSLGGTTRLATWAKEDPANERVFWGTIYPKLLPLNIDATVRHGLAAVLGSLGSPKDNT